MQKNDRSIGLVILNLKPIILRIPKKTSFRKNQFFAVQGPVEKQTSFRKLRFIFKAKVNLCELKLEIKNKFYELFAYLAQYVA